jgi:hypothetical protein
VHEELVGGSLTELNLVATAPGKQFELSLSSSEPTSRAGRRTTGRRWNGTARVVDGTLVEAVFHESSAPRRTGDKLTGVGTARLRKRAKLVELRLTWRVLVS